MNSKANLGIVSWNQKEWTCLTMVVVGVRWRPRKQSVQTLEATIVKVPTSTWTIDDVVGEWVGWFEECDTRLSRHYKVTTILTLGSASDWSLSWAMGIIILLPPFICSACKRERLYMYQCSVLKCKKICFFCLNCSPNLAN
jgi:hypothetical protein